MKRRVPLCMLGCVFMLLSILTVHSLAYAHTQKPVDTGFSEHKGNGYIISYPKDWTFSTNTTNAGGYVGDFFTDPTNTYVFHVYPSQDKTSDKQILDHLLTSDLRSTLLPGASTITMNSVIWQQGKALSTDQVTNKPFERIGWVSKNPVAPAFIPYFVLHAEGDPAAFEQYTEKYFLPMLHSFRFTR
ncbi:hypothetical protein KDW_37560 [Dictyobacter vulcani]|uniref:Uncharacterized protein n=1 Tax=Dictyobacter vulcani TaxID=2607529 RepID=A0A5J4KJC6_9CHLR|nr:hypothetical protein [Dictyobacter vulcani]GER89594.1 hypothetical protein KDW_37560 [Dictyobacter vulcani]